MPTVSFYNNDSTPSGGTVINNANPLAFGVVSRGTIGQLGAAQLPFHLWNDKNSPGTDTMYHVKVGITDSSGGNTGEFNTGTVGNGHVPFFEAKSQGSFGCPDDGQAVFTPIGNGQFLSIGDIPANARRSIWLQCDVPSDATSGASLLNALVVVDYTVTA